MFECFINNGGETSIFTKILKNNNDFNIAFIKTQGNYYPKAEALEIDFPQYAIIVIYFNQLNYGGFSCRGKNVEEVKNEIKVILTTPKVNLKYPVTNVITTPYLFFSIPKIDATQVSYKIVND